MPKLSELGMFQPKKTFKLSELQPQQPITQQQMLAAGAQPGVAITDEQIQKIRQGQQITPPERQLGTEAGRFELFREPEAGTAGQSFVSGAKLGATGMGAGALKGLESVANISKEMFGLEPTKISEDISQTMDIEQARNRAIAEQFPGINVAGQIAGEIAAAPTLGPFGKTKAAKLVTGTVSGALAGGLSAAGRNEDAINASLMGAGFGAGFQGLSEGAQAIAKRIINAKAGKFATKEIEELISTAEREGVPIFSDDISQNIGLQKLGILAEDIPLLGTRGGRLKQSKAQEELALRLQSEFSTGIEDTAVTLQAGLKNKLALLKKVRRGKFDKASKLLDPKGKIPIQDFRVFVVDLIRQEQKLGTLADENLLNQLIKIVKAPDGDFTAIRNISATIGDNIKDIRKGAQQALGSKAEIPLQKAKEKLDDVVSEWVEKTGTQQGKKAFSSAMDFSRDKITIPFGKTALKRMVDTARPEEIITMLLSGAGRAKKGTKSTAKILFNSLDDKGRQAARAAMLDDAFNKATSAGKRFSPATFASSLENLEKTLNVFFRGENRTRINGIVKLMRATQRAGAISEFPATGARFIIPGVLSNVAGAPVAAVAGAVGTFGLTMKGMLQSQTGKRILFGLGKSTPGTKQFEFWSNRFSQFATRLEASRAE